MKEFNEAYQAYMQCGRNKAEAARMLGIPVTTFKHRLDRALETYATPEPVIGFWDTEISKKISMHYDMYDVSINTDDILMDFFMISAAWKIKGGDKVYDVSILDDMKAFKKNNFDIRKKITINDEVVIRGVHAFLTGCDIIVHHYGDKFDMKKFNARAIKFGLKPIGKKMTVDTCKVAKSVFGFTSNSLKYLCDYFEIPNKLETSKGMAKGATLCEPDKIKEMIAYNKRDVFPALEKLYDRLLPYIVNHPDMRMWYGKDRCKNCGSPDIVIDETLSFTKTNAKQQSRCNACGGLTPFGKPVMKVG